MSEAAIDVPVTTAHIHLHDLLPEASHRALLDRVDDIVARVGPEAPLPPPPTDDPLADQRATGFEADLGDLWPEVETAIRSVAGIARRELGLDHFTVDSVAAILTVHREDGVFHTAPFGNPGSRPSGGERGIPTRRIEFVYTFTPDAGAYEGGQLRLYDSVLRQGFRAAADTYTEVESVDNAVVLFASDAHHEVVRITPTREGAVRYTLSGWLAGDPISRRARPEVDPATQDVLQQRLLRRHADAGFVVRPTPAPVQQLLASLLELRAARAVPEAGDPTFQQGGYPDLVDVADVSADVLEHLRSIHEEFADVRLLPSQTYGIRVYRRGQSLRMHLDRPETHIVSSVLQIAQDVDRPWPLQIDIAGRRHEVVLNPGQMLLYEGAACLHGRIAPLEGESYANLFVHYRPVYWRWSTDALIDTGLRDGLIDRDGRLVAD